MSTGQRASGTSRSPPVNVSHSPGLTCTLRKPIEGDRLMAVLACVVATEFVGVAAAAYLASVGYNKIILMRLPPTEDYVTAAAFIAIMVLLVSLSFRHFAAIQSQNLRRFVWSGLGAVGVSFSFFLTAMFAFKTTDIYSRGTFFVQLVTVTIAIAVFRAVAFSWIRSAIARGYVAASRVVVIGEEFLYSP